MVAEVLLFGVIPCSQDGCDVVDLESLMQKYWILLTVMRAGSTSTAEHPLLGENGEC